ncbi:MAG: GatB/YqeY domain-containing protein [Clostridia bacterium]|nr:GatB/YqeY domain-containing protein [Clostridia bacterium]
MIEEQIKKANIEAMKNKDTVARAFYSVLMNKILLEKIAKGQRDQMLADADVSNIVQKVIKELNDEKENYQKVGNAEEVANLNRQLEIASSYLPKQLSKDEIKAIILGLDDKTIPTVMKHFKANYNGQVDMRLVQEVLKELA